MGVKKESGNLRRHSALSGSLPVFGVIFAVRSCLLTFFTLECYPDFMARPLRIEFEGALYHVTSRGDKRRAIFLDDADRAAFLKILGDVVGRFGWLCHAYCLT